MRRFITSTFTLLLLQSVSLMAVHARQANPLDSIESLAPRVTTEEKLIDQNLLTLQGRETKGWSPESVDRFNQATVARYERQMVYPSFQRDPYTGRVLSVDLDYVRNLYKSMIDHPIINYDGERPYQQEGTSIGYCFGRAFYLHMALLRLGLDSRSIKKVWIAGPMTADDIFWSFHVATMIPVAGKGWMVIDTVRKEPMTLRAWYKSFRVQTVDGRSRLYVTDPRKFGMVAGAYDPVQMGLNVSKDQDWYKGYFSDVLSWFESDESQAFFEQHGLIIP